VKPALRLAPNGLAAVLLTSPHQKEDTMKRWLRENPWIWIVLFFAVMVAGSFVTVVIAQLNRPEIVKVG
jgi:hypothetical protein